MRTNEAGIKLIQGFEGLRLEAYKCPRGIWTIGYGWTGLVDKCPIKAGMVITKEKANELFRSSLPVYEGYVKALGRDFNEKEFSSLVSFVYNCGPARLQSLCNHRTNSQIAEALLLYNKAGGKVLAGLTKRRKAERELFLKLVDNKIQTLPYKVKAKCNLNIRGGAGTSFPQIRIAKAGEILTVWATETNGDTVWAKNGSEYFALKYCEPL